MNEEVLKMVRTLHARLDDVEAAVRALPSDQPQFAQQLDKVDDKVYLIQCEIQKLVNASAGTASSHQSSQASAESGDDVHGDDGVPSASSADDAGSKTDVDPTAAQAAVDDVEPVSASSGSDSEGDEKPLISDEMKDNLKDAGRALGGILKESKDVVSELSGTVSDLKSVFKFK